MQGDPSAQVRFCPKCGKSMFDAVCPQDSVPTVSAELFKEDDALLPEGTLIGEGRYRIDQALSQGGMGAVYVGEQVAVKRRVVVKTILRSFVSQRRHVQRFYQEAQAACRLGHPNIVRVFDFGIDSHLGVPYIVMEYLHGHTLSALVQDNGPMPELRAAAVLLQATRGLVEAHAYKIVHRDLKPGNIMVCPLLDGGELVKVLDFGLAKLEEEEDAENAEQRKQLTETGTILGTALYMSPEQFNRQDVDTRTDLYSLGAVLHFALTGAPPYDAADRVQIAIQQLTKPIPELPSVLSDGMPPSPGLRAVHRALLGKKKEDRPAKTLGVANALAALMLGRPVDPLWLTTDGAVGGPPVDRHRAPIAQPQHERTEMAEVARTQIYGLAGGHSYEPSVPSAAASDVSVGGAPPVATGPHDGPERPWLPWAAAGLAAVILFSVLGVFILGGGDGKTMKPKTVPVDGPGTPGAGEGEGAGAAAGPSAEEPPEQLSASTLKDSLARADEPLKKCYGETRPADIEVELTIVSSGEVTEAKIVDAPGADDTVKDCLSKVLRETAFPPFTQPEMRFAYTVGLSE